MRHLLAVLRADLDSKDEKKLDLFVDDNFGASSQFKDQFILSHAINDGLRSQDFPVEKYRSNLRYLDVNDDGPHHHGVNGENNQGLSMTCLHDGDLPLTNNLSGQEDFTATRTSTEAANPSHDDELDLPQPKDDSLPLQDNHEESYHSSSQDNTELSEKTSPANDDLREDNDGNQKSVNDLPELDQDSNLDSKPRDLEDLEQSFAEMVQVSRTEDILVHETETETVPSDHEEIYDQDDF